MIINRIYENQKSSVAVACFLPGLAKDLSAPLLLVVTGLNAAQFSFIFGWYYIPFSALALSYPIAHFCNASSVTRSHCVSTTCRPRPLPFTPLVNSKRIYKWCERKWPWPIRCHHIRHYGNCASEKLSLKKWHSYGLCWPRGTGQPHGSQDPQGVENSKICGGFFELDSVLLTTPCPEFLLWVE